MKNARTIWNRWKLAQTISLNIKRRVISGNRAFSNYNTGAQCLSDLHRVHTKDYSVKDYSVQQ